MDIVDRLLEYRKSNDMKFLITSNIDINQENLNVIVIEILAWLKLEHKRYLWMEEGKKTSLKPLKISMRYSWYADLCLLVAKESLFRKFFKIVNEDFTFSETITEQEKKIAREKAYKNYNPQKNS